MPEEWVEVCGERNAVGVGGGGVRGVNEVDRASSQCCAGVCTQSDESRHDLFFNLELVSLLYCRPPLPLFN